MNINSDINILGSLLDLNLITYFYEHKDTFNKEKEISSFTVIKTNRSVKRFKKAITSTLLSFKNENIKSLFKSLITEEGLSENTLLFLFWNTSLNNDLFRYLNDNVYFPAFYSGRISINNDEAVACLNELKNSEEAIKKWSFSTMTTTGSKYLTLLKKFGLMEGTQIKNIKHPFMSDKLFILFVYWLVAESNNNNLINNPLLKYGFTESQIFLDRIRKRQFVSYFNIFYTGDNLKIEPLIECENIYENIKRN